MLYESDSWVVKVKHIYKKNFEEIQMLRWICGHTKFDKIRNDYITRMFK